MCAAASPAMARCACGWRTAAAMRTAPDAFRAGPDAACGKASATASAPATGSPKSAEDFPICRMGNGGFAVAHARLLQADRQQRIDLAAVEDDGALGEARGRTVEHDPVVVASGREHRGLAGVHDARDHEARARP